jgi:nucleotide-binding universal stress UspA family protein
MMKRILVAYDGSDSAEKAFDFALGTACPGAVQPDIVVLSVVQPPDAAAAGSAVEIVVNEMKRYYDGLLKALREKAAEKKVEVKTEVAVGHPAEEILKFAKEGYCDMIVVGQVGKSKVETWLLGSVSRRVVTYAPCTVVVVK